jgi:N-acetylmuramoyl-L-alanine amidase
MTACLTRFVICCFGAIALASTVSAQTRYNTVVIDAGHGGFDRGGIPGQRVPEKMMTLDVALKLKPLLEKAGYRVVMTRSTDIFVPLGSRVAIANSYPNAIFVCIHFNSASRSGANGIETYFYSTESAPLAASIHSAVVGGARSENRGVRRRGYFVLRRTTVPAVLVECGFLTNPGEAQAALTNSYRHSYRNSAALPIVPPSRLVPPILINPRKLMSVCSLSSINVLSGNQKPGTAGIIQAQKRKSPPALRKRK